MKTLQYGRHRSRLRIFQTGFIVGLFAAIPLGAEESLPPLPPDPVVALAFDRATMETRGNLTLTRPAHPSSPEGRILNAEPVPGVAREALRFRGRSPASKIFNNELRLKIGAVKALGGVGGEKSDQALSRFISRWSNPITRALFFPLRSVIHSEDLIKAAKDNRARVRYRLASRA